MMRPTISGLLRIVSAAFLLLCNARAQGQFQMAHPDEQGFSAEDVSPLVLVFKGMHSLIYEHANARYWDSSAGHYRGNLLHALRYPEIAAAGYRSFSVVSLQSYHGGPDLRYGSPESILKQTAEAVARDNGRETKVYHFNDSGWLRAIVSTRINPAYESFAEASDSLFYDFQPDGSARLRWKHESYSTASGRGSGRSGCPPPLPFMTIRESQSFNASFDRWQNLSGYTYRSEEIWDTCRGEGTVYQKRSVTYDSLGRILSVTDSSGGYPSPAAELTISYECLPFERFERAVSSDYQLAPLREATIRNRLLSQDPLSAVLIRRTKRNFVHYDHRIRGNSFPPDSPRVDQDTGFYIVNRKMEYLASRAPGQRQALAIYDHGTDSASGAPVFRVQYLPVPPDPAAGPVTVCDPLALGSVWTSGLQHSVLGSDTLIRFMKDDPGGGSVQKLRFSALPPTTVSAQLRSMALKDKRGLVQYLWTGSDTYQLSYRR